MDLVKFFPLRFLLQIDSVYCWEQNSKLFVHTNFSDRYNERNDKICVYEIVRNPKMAFSIVFDRTPFSIFESIARISVNNIPKFQIAPHWHVFYWLKIRLWVNDMYRRLSTSFEMIVVLTNRKRSIENEIDRVIWIYYRLELLEYSHFF